LASLLFADSEATVDLLDKMIQSYADGRLPHATEAFTMLFEVLSDEHRTPGVNVPPVTSVSRELLFTSWLLISFVQGGEHFALLVYAEDGADQVYDKRYFP